MSTKQRMEEMTAEEIEKFKKDGWEECSYQHKNWIEHYLTKDDNEELIKVELNNHKPQEYVTIHQFNLWANAYYIYSIDKERVTELENILDTEDLEEIEFTDVQEKLALIIERKRNAIN